MKPKSKKPLYKTGKASAPLYVSKKDRALMLMKQKPTKIAQMAHNKKGRLIEAYQETRGNVTDACRAANVGRRTFYNWVEKDLQFAQAIVEADEDLRFEVRSALVEKIAQGNIAAIIFWLKNKDPDFKEERTAFGVQFGKDGLKVVFTRGE